MPQYSPRDGGNSIFQFHHLKGSTQPEFLQLWIKNHLHQNYTEYVLTMQIPWTWLSVSSGNEESGSSSDNSAEGLWDPVIHTHHSHPSVPLPNPAIGKSYCMQENKFIEENYISFHHILFL